ncbi:amidophosphoribosyltransferase isoform X2 [Sigmodon hispidus]
MELEELGIREECGVFGYIASGEWPTQLDVQHVITLGLVGLQHRGQENAGIVISEGSSVPFKVHKGMGLANHVFTEEIICLKPWNRSHEICHDEKMSAGDPVAFVSLNMFIFARPDSMFEDQMVYTVRYRCGQQLAVEVPVEADLVSTVLESAMPAALGYAAKCGLPYVEVLSKNRYVGRTFIQPNMRLRQLGVAKKFGVLSDNFKGKRIVLIDDSVVRGNTISPIIKLLKESWAKEVHIRVASPPIKYPCFMGINIPTKEELIANKPEFGHLAEYLGANSVIYLSVEGLV